MDRIINFSREYFLYYNFNFNNHSHHFKENEEKSYISRKMTMEIYYSLLTAILYAILDEIIVKR